MPMYSINDRVLLSDRRGGWDGYIASIGPLLASVPTYEVRSPARGDRREGNQIVAEVDIVKALAAPVFQVGQQVTLGGHGGVIVVDNYDGTFAVDVSEWINKNIKAIRRHVVPLWLLATENGS